MECFDRSYNSNDYQVMMDDYNLVLKNIIQLANQFNLTTSFSLIALIEKLLYDGRLSVSCSFIYDSDNSKSINFASYDEGVKIVMGSGSCINIACHLKKVLESGGFNCDVIFTRLIDGGKEKVECFSLWGTYNHVINYINDGLYGYSYDLVNSCFYYCKDNEWNDFFYSYAIPIYERYPDYTRFDLSEKDAILCFRKRLEVYTNYYDTLTQLSKNEDVLAKFYLDNLELYQEISSCYKKIYEKNLKIRLVR